MFFTFSKLHDQHFISKPSETKIQISNVEICVQSDSDREPIQIVIVWPEEVSPTFFCLPEY